MRRTIQSTDAVANMHILYDLIHIILHLNTYLGVLFNEYGTWVYAILFAVIFCETGLVITPFLPGDSLLFAAGSLFASSHLNLHALFFLLIMAAFCGDNTNYWFGRWLGHKVFSLNVRWLKKEYLDRSHAFYQKYGGQSIIIARFIPIVRTFVPFVAGVSEMRYQRYIGFSLFAAVLWVGLLVYAGYYFGSIPIVQRNFSFVILGIIILSILPPIIQWWRARRR